MKTLVEVWRAMVFPWWWLASIVSVPVGLGVSVGSSRAFGAGVLGCGAALGVQSFHAQWRKVCPAPTAAQQAAKRKPTPDSVPGQTWEELRALKRGTILVDSEMNGIAYRIVRGPYSLCAYVCCPARSPLIGHDYDDVDLDVHGGLTFAGPKMVLPPRRNDEWWFGWDYSHVGDQTFDANGGLKGLKWTAPMVMTELDSVTRAFAKISRPPLVPWLHRPHRMPW